MTSEYLASAYRRIFAKVDKGEDGCWRWLGAKTGNGYGQVCVSGRSWLVHRFLYEQECGVIPEGMQIDHLCRTRHCVNPEHLEVVTPGENLRRGDAGGWQRRLDHCKYGHPFDDENT